MASGKKLKFAAVLTCLALGACALFTAGEPPAAPAGAAMSAAGNALDEIILSDIAASVGEMTFMHKTHYTPKSEGGRGVGCADCHHDYAADGSSVPGSCRKCHYQSHNERGPGRITL